MSEIAPKQSNLPLEYSTKQNQLNILGFWIFLGAELALFATLFATYLVLVSRTAGGPGPEELYELKTVLIETFLLLTSSFTCGLAVYEMRRGKQAGMIGWLIVTILLGIGFLYFEIEEFILYAVHEGATMQTSAFLSSFFALVGTHGLHVTIGIFWILIIILQVLKRGLNADTARKVFISSLYWHFLDVVWIFLFTLVYLTGMVS
ncbi:MAG: cytochrome aa3 quinol oxidase subunit III [Bacillaceae bacterium]|jgi:cytochrome aa3-600 menaquinol oxidase subunit 3|uniref:Quinol oxidase subunit 3 n=2 Tax=Aeribacillus TaxID=1055323 RepID=A0A165WTS6_9BACI|nr:MULTISPECIES: cytochrome aa3 quinol oxidase subunit III [Aeribacillus]REJ13008.1 MAG: cytochrome aa3 quinol oxidase subunit III [Bacillaceae bacterium]ASS89571.1 cytochrome aa3 quinol oxidase subunit III [Aeribacillus pallidus]KZM53358.1 cytochrome o ubiquinol oxidase subunit III [Aeribacillus pallidus]KZN95313.1 cytochrome o ubiquinol oxidase subunit III [Aeribacillus pallidus]MDR9793093.1 cytochrome aa3 quinol oxidase subunit III [Aeribacillus pallidus]